jgi:hypothetical protein
MAGVPCNHAINVMTVPYIGGLTPTFRDLICVKLRLSASIPAFRDFWTKIALWITQN